MFCHPGVDLLGAVDPDQTARDRFSRAYQLPAWPSLMELCNGRAGLQVDLVVVAVPPAVQPALVEQLLNCVCPRLVLLEKPVATHPSAAERLHQVCKRQRGMIVAVNYIRRYLPVVQMLQTSLLAGELGEFLHGHLVYGKGLLSNGSHFVNLAEAWLGSLYQIGSVMRGSKCESFDYETNLTLYVGSDANARLHVSSIGSCGLRAGELDLWFTAGRLCWENSGRSLLLWKPIDVAPGHARELLIFEINVETGMDDEGCGLR